LAALAIGLALPAAPADCVLVVGRTVAAGPAWAMAVVCEALFDMSCGLAADGPVVWADAGATSAAIAIEIAALLITRLIGAPLADLLLVL
jgi:hypothetical protein